MESMLGRMERASGGSGGGGGKKDEDSCGWCDDFSSGPCRVPFRLWMQCCEEHPQDYASICKNSFQTFHKCLEKDAQQAAAK
jgi:hypothetical protein